VSVSCSPPTGIPFFRVWVLVVYWIRKIATLDARLSREGNLYLIQLCGTFGAGRREQVFGFNWW
jgi:hypothetical protein